MTPQPYYNDEASTSFLQTALFYQNKENKHVLILAEDDWRNRHIHRNEIKPFHLNYDLSFLNIKYNQELLCEFIDTFLIGSPQNDLTQLFYNSIELFNRAIKYQKSDVEVYILLMMTTAETLLTQNRNEKRLRLSAIIPRIIKHNELNNTELAKIINKFYYQRNNFVHAGSSELKDIKKCLEPLNQIISKIIVYYFTFTDNIAVDNQANQFKRWNEHVNEIFENIIFGIDNESDS